MRKQGPSQLISKDKGWRRKRIRGTKPPSGQAKHAEVASQRRPARRQPSLLAGLAVMSGRTAGAISRRLNIGGGTSIAGLVAQRLYPDIVGRLAAQLEYGSVVVTGTNGKTTTSGFIGAILRDAGLRVWRNREGSNLMRGVAGALVIRALPSGNLRGSGHAISIFEVDEAVIPQVVPLVSPRVAVFTNLFRDQLDRYGEVDSVNARWQQAVKLLPEDATLVLNADDPTAAHLGELFTGPILYFGIEDAGLEMSNLEHTPERHQVIDTRACPRCGSEYLYTKRFYSHMGHYHCPNCGLARPTPDVRVTAIQTDSFDRLRIQVETANRRSEIVIPLPGLYNIYNALAAITTAQALKIGWDPIVMGIEQFKPAFGRGERVQMEGRTLRLLLAKNPTGFNEVLRTLFSEGTPRHVLFVLNDNVADGRDVSWIWDVDFERAAEQVSTLVVAGARALDLALRLKYAGIDPDDMTIVPPTALRAQRQDDASRGRPGRRQRKAKAHEPVAMEFTEGEHKETSPAGHIFGLPAALDEAISQTPQGATLFVVPTYTGLLEIHTELERRGVTPHYWEGSEG